MLLMFLHQRGGQYGIRFRISVRVSNLMVFMLSIRNDHTGIAQPRSKYM